MMPTTSPIAGIIRGPFRRMVTRAIVIVSPGRRPDGATRRTSAEDRSSPVAEGNRERVGGGELDRIEKLSTSADR